MKKGILISVIIVIIVILLAGFYFYNNRIISPSPITQTDVPSGSSAPPAPPSNLPSTSHTIQISGYAFSPNSLTIKQGEDVTWTNQDSAPHTIISDLGNEIQSTTLS